MTAAHRLRAGPQRLVHSNSSEPMHTGALRQAKQHLWHRLAKPGEIA